MLLQILNLSFVFLRRRDEKTVPLVIGLNMNEKGKAKRYTTRTDWKHKIDWKCAFCHLIDDIFPCNINYQHAISLDKIDGISSNIKDYSQFVTNLHSVMNLPILSSNVLAFSGWHCTVMAVAVNENYKCQRSSHLVAVPSLFKTIYAHFV